MKKTFTGYLSYQKPLYIGDDGFRLRMWKPDDDGVLVKEQSIEVDIPDDFDPRPGMVANLKESRAKVHADFAKRVAEIDAEIQSLLALEAA